MSCRDAALFRGHRQNSRSCFVTGQDMGLDLTAPRVPHNLGRQQWLHLVLIFLYFRFSARTFSIRTNSYLYYTTLISCALPTAAFCKQCLPVASCNHKLIQLGYWRVCVQMYHQWRVCVHLCLCVFLFERVCTQDIDVVFAN